MKKGLIKLTARIIPDKLYLQILYYKHFRKFINFKYPKSFNEKLQWLKLYDRNPKYTIMVDKYAVKKYVAKTIGKEYIIPTLGVWNNAKDIDFDSLPNQFVLKCNNDSGGVVICKDKTLINKEKTIAFLSKHLRNNGFWYGREWPYKNVFPRIIAEKYMENTSSDDSIDFKVLRNEGVINCVFSRHGSFNNSSTRMDEKSVIRLDSVIKIQSISDNQYSNIVDLVQLLDKLPSTVKYDIYLIDKQVILFDIKTSITDCKRLINQYDIMKRFGRWTKLPRDCGIGYYYAANGLLLSVKSYIEMGLTDYKIYCFNGKPKFLYVSRGLGTAHDRAEISFYDLNWNELPFVREDFNSLSIRPKRPKEFNKMLNLASQLAHSTRFLRVDFYVINDNIYFSELTLYPCSGLMKFKPAVWDSIVGKYLKL